MDLSKSDLIVDKVYGGSRKGNASDDPLPSLLSVDSGAGFRHLGQRPGLSTLKLLVLKTSFSNPDWPDYLDYATGLFTYYGDNQKPGRELHDTPRKGNSILRNLFDGRHDHTITNHFPPIFLFSSTGVYRDVRFLGIAVPGTESMGADDDLVGIWRTGGGTEKRFQNYKAVFTVLNVPTVSRAWILDIQKGNAATSPHAPKAWLSWLRKRIYTPLHAPRSIEIRDKSQQLPANKDGQRILEQIYSRYKTNPYSFEKCAAEIAKLMMPQIMTCDLTRPWRDGGRDATGTFHIGDGQSAIEVDFALEAKCYATKSSVGVKELSRLLSRLRHRQFGILVTTSFLGTQAFKELKDDKHPVVVISGGDIVNLLQKKIGDFQSIAAWLSRIDQTPNI